MWTYEVFCVLAAFFGNVLPYETTKIGRRSFSSPYRLIATQRTALRRQHYACESEVQLPQRATSTLSRADIARVPRRAARRSAHFSRTMIIKRLCVMPPPCSLCP